MADQPSDDAVATVEKARFDGLMSSHQKALAMLTPEQRASLKGGATETDGAQTVETAGSQAPDAAAEEEGFEPGTMLRVGEDGKPVPVGPPQPRSHNAARERVWDDPYERKADREARQGVGGYPI